MAAKKKPTPADGLMTVSATLPAELVQRVDQLATAESRSRSSAIAILVARALDAGARQAG